MDTAETSLQARSALLRLGFTARELRRMRRRGDLALVRPGYYLAGPEPASAESQHRFQIRAALGTLADGSVVSHWSAAVWHGLPIWPRPPTQVQVTRARRSGGRVDPRVHLHSAPLRADEIVQVDGIPVTSVGRTVADLARATAFESGVATADGALALSLATPEELADAVARCKGWRGCPKARQVVAFADGCSESVGESRSRVAIARLGLPTPLLQWEVWNPYGQLVGRVDFGWPQLRVVGEFNGRTKYGRLLLPGQDPGEVVYQEKLHEDELRAQRLTVVRWTWRDLPNFAASRPAARLREALA